MNYLLTGGIKMRSFAYFFMAAFVFLLASCSSNSQPTSKLTVKQNEQPVEVEKGPKNVEIKIPASMFEGQDIDAVIAEAKKQGVKEVIKNEDGSLTYKMSKETYNTMMEKIKEGILQTIDDLKNNKEYVSIIDISYNDTFSEFTWMVDKKAYQNSMDKYAAMGLAMSSMMYQQYKGIADVDQKVTIYVKDQANQELIDTITYPDNLKKQE